MFISNDFKRPSKDRHGDAAKELDCEEDFNPIRLKPDDFFSILF